MVEQYSDSMICPITGLTIPKRLDLNVKWRQRVLAECEKSEVARRKVYTACSKSILYWINLMCWTYRPKKTNAEGKEVAITGMATHVPFITWKIQDTAILGLVDAIGTGDGKGGHDVAIDKARDMGATWICLMVFMWFWLFKSNTTFLVLSRKEDLVDRRGSMDSLFEKMRYTLKWLPNWMQPNTRDTYMHLENKDNGAVIDGESTNENAGQASRSTATLLDEFARVPNGEAIDIATADTTACRIFNSTPGSPTAHFTKIIRSKRVKIIPLPWWSHPEKGRDLFLVEAAKVKGKGASLPLPPDKSGWKWVSPWYVIEDARRSLRNIAQNLDMEHGRVGDMIFDPDLIEKHRTTFARHPDMVGTFRYPHELAEREKKNIIRKMLRNEAPALNTVLFSKHGGILPWKLWLDLIEYEIPGSEDPETKRRTRIFRPDQDTRYVVGVDVAVGTGSSNSVVTIKDHKSGRIVAKYWDAYTPPEALAEIVMFVCAWFGGRKSPYVVFEKNGPGMQFGRKLIEYGYPSMYYQTDDSKRGKVKTKRWGWHSSNQRKELLIGEYRDALFTGKIINPCHEALDEAIDYVFDDAGRVTPGSSGMDEGSGATATHGDHVISDGLCVLGSSDLPDEKDATEHAVPHGTHASRRQFAKKALDERRYWED